MELVNTAGVADAQSPEDANMDGGVRSEYEPPDEQRLACAITRISERFAAEPTEFVLIDAVADELSLAGVDPQSELAELIELFGRVCWERMQHNGVGETPRQKAYTATREAASRVLHARKPSRKKA